MRRIKHKKSFSYKLTFWNGSDCYLLKATSPKDHEGYKVAVSRFDGISIVLKVPDLGGRTPQIAFSRVKKYLKETFPADPESLAMDRDFKNSMRRMQYANNKKPYVSSKTKS